ncbi:methyl-accepting chemotaxis protein [Bacillus sp. Bva_UNVM-123]|uniref:methyl-accepting chemotaxis protein n=1 Tax=Bacillus sp. Bva_UNVM-123 TaxID=2829798 RepID=UPI00391F225C
MKKSILYRLIVIVAVVILLSLAIISFANNRMTYLKVKESAGMELYGCANITTGLLSVDEVNQLNSLSPAKAEEVGKKIDWTTEMKPIFENQYIISSDGKVLVADTKSQSQGIKVGDQTPIELDKIKALLDTKEPVFSEIYEYAGMKRLTGYAPIFKNHERNGEIIAISAIDFNAEIITERTWSMSSSTIFVGIASLLIAALIIILFVRRTILPLRRLTEYTKQISQGDLSIEMQTIKATGEVHTLNENFNAMVTNLKSALQQTSATSKELAASTEELSVGSSEITKIVDEVSKTFQDIAESANDQSKEAESIQNVFQKITERTNEMTERIQITSQDSLEVSSFAMKGNTIIVESMEQMGHIQSSTEDIALTMRELKGKSNSINDILNIIMNISKQTHLLALNASIESARAGEHGKGFAIVAEEIRSLAEETSSSIESIKSIIYEIGSKTEEAVNLTEKGNRIVHEGIEKVKNAGDSFNQIKESTKKLSEDVVTVLNATVSIKDEIKEANHQVTNIASISKDISNQMQNVAASSEEQAASMEEISAATQTLVNMANDMESLANQFKLD